jgi:hypothetical protein
LDHEGQKTQAITVGGRFLKHVTSADLDGDGQPDYCGVAAAAETNDVIVGFQVDAGFPLDGTELWQHPLAAGIHPTPIEMVTTSRRLPGDPAQWIVAGPDGAILVITADGQLADHAARPHLM